ncbi:transcription factor bHLH30-like [Impatiens glandulifera]|uniref:transcription factor bHLH30-like n=1 Tax=Impatiens glandulifera TaxID=253017 RepID=UPI001FB16FED|nr:transcription factor bHLH30-like [Impatiens glandulifera]
MMNMTGSLVGRGHGPNYSPDLGGGSMSVSQSLVLDAEKCELVKSNVVNRDGKKDGLSEEKIMAALKSHSEAERRRRERINAHLSTLRGLVPSNEKMDKAALLAEVISQVKQMKETANEASKGLLIPLDSDEVKITPLKAKGGSLINSFTATLCCNYRPHLLSEVRQALNALHLTVVKAEISTLGTRVKHLFVFTSRNEMMMIDSQSLANSVHQALTMIVDKGSSVSTGYSPRTTTTNMDKKRQRISYIESSSSSS